MNSSLTRTGFRSWTAVALLALLGAGCGSSDDGRGEILGGGGGATLAPSAVLFTPSDGSAGVSVNAQVSVSFDRAMAPLTAGDFTVTCAAPCTNPTGSLAFDATNTIATFTLTPGTTFAPMTQYTASINAGTDSAAGLPLINPTVWRFTTDARPVVLSFTPGSGATGVSNGTTVTAFFDQPVTLTAGSFTLTCVAPCPAPVGTVALNPAGTMLTFTQTVPNQLQPGQQYTATVVSATSVSTGLGLAGPTSWQFTTVPRPQVTVVAPLDEAVGVPINNTVITVAFNEPVQSFTTSGATFTVTCVLPCVSATGTVARNSTNRIVTFTLTPATTLEPSTRYTAIVTGATSIASGLAMAAPYQWEFTTGLTPDTTRPRVVITQPVTTVPGPTLAVATNTAITAVFTEDMDPLSIEPPLNTFTVTCALPCINPLGEVTYAVGSRTARFTPFSVLDAGVTYTARITQAATDLALNALAGNQAALPAASDYVWTFTTAAAIPPQPVSVTSTDPDTGELLVCPDATINATFSVPSLTRMDDLTLDANSFSVTGPGLATVTASSVVFDGLTGTIATFTPQNPLVDGDTYSVTILGGASGVKDLAVPQNEMLANYTWLFTVGPDGPTCLVPADIDLGAATPFGLASTAGVVNAATLPNTLINGDVVMDPNQTCNLVTVPNDGTFGLCNGFDPDLNGLVYTDTFPGGGEYLTVKNDLNAAFLSTCAPGLPSASCSLTGGFTVPAPSTMGAPAGSALVLYDNYFTPGVYMSATTMDISGDITLDGRGNANAVFVFQMGSALNIAAGAVSPGPHTRIRLTGGAKASNVWWSVGSSATIGTFAEFEGNVLAAFDITMENGATSCGRMMSGAWVGGSGALVFESNTVSIPGNGCPP